MLRRNQLHDNSVAVSITKNGMGVFEDNKVFDNDFGVAIKGEGANPSLIRNTITRNRKAGIVVFEGGGAIIEDNDLRHNAHAGLRISAESRNNVKHTRNKE